MREMNFQNAFIGLLRSSYGNARHDVRFGISRSPTSRRLSSLRVRRTTLDPSIGRQLAYTRTEKLSRVQKKTFATAGSRNSQREIAVIGGGITGLTTAHYLARYAKNAHITLYDGSQRLGGWIHGETMRVGSGEDDEVLFQRGPRILRPYTGSTKYDDVILYDVLANLNMTNSIRWIRRKTKKDRYLYYPDHLVKMPSPGFNLNNILALIQSYLSEPIWDGTASSYLRLLLNRSPEYNDGSALDQDESIGDFFDRLFRDDRITKNILSAMIHGIYGGDVYKLSAKHSVFDRLWRETKTPIPKHGWIYTDYKDYILFRDMLNSPNGRYIPVVTDDINTNNIDSIAFDDGLVTLVDGLVEDLREQKNVTIKTGHPVTSLAYKNGKVWLKTKDELPKQYDRVVSTIFSKHLAKIVQPAGALSSLEDTHAVTIMVVNLWFPNPHILYYNHGFGYLIPSSTPNNEECLLGVLFDSDLQLQPDSIPGTKVTAMLGGHYWDGWATLPTKEMAEEMAKAAVRRHLNLDPTEPVFASAKLCRDCLPQHLLGHRQRMAEAHHDLMSTFKGLLSVAGPSYSGTGVIPAMRSAFDIAMTVSHGRGPPWFGDKIHPTDVPVIPPELKNHNPHTDHVGMTGLLGFTRPDRDTILPTPKRHLWGKKWQTHFPHEMDRRGWTDVKRRGGDAERRAGLKEKGRFDVTEV
ncbi:Protoporphyrinogen oxidase [Annulohypoxylon moriforme]|nr:Protoporphyrinogen oxidase [Annulohypoxylon moriforme]